MRNHQRCRKGFTLVELLVALALILFIMSILSQAFVTAAQSFNQLKAMGDLAERMRSTATVMRRDLGAYHFEGTKRLSDSTFWTYGPPLSGFFRVTQYNGSSDPTNPYSGQYEGTDYDGINSYLTTNATLHFSVQLTGNRRSDYFSGYIPPSSPLSGNSGASFYPAPDNYYQDVDNSTGGLFTSQWGEVAYFLRPTTGYSANGTQLYALYRRCRVTVPIPGPTTGTRPSDSSPSHSNQYPLISNFSVGNVINFNLPSDLTVPPRRFGMTPWNTSNSSHPEAAGLFYPALFYPPPANATTYPTLLDEWNVWANASPPPSSTTPDLRSADLILSDVVSFDVRLLINTPGTAPTQVLAEDNCIDLFSPDIQQNFNNNNPQFYNQTNNPTKPAVFDSWSQLNDPTTPAPPNNVNYSNAWAPTTPPSPTSFTIPTYQGPSATYPIQILGLQVILRCWDYKTGQTRQMTIFQEL